MSEQRTYTAAERERIEELVSAYVLGALAEDDAAFREFESLLEADDPFFAETLETMLEASSILAMAAPQVDAPASVRVELMESIAHIKNDKHTGERSSGYIGDSGAIATSVIKNRLKKRTRIFLGVSLVAAMAIAILGGLLIEKNAFISVRNVAVNTLLRQRDSLAAVVGKLAQNDSVSRMMLVMFTEKNSEIVTLAKMQEPQPENHHIFFSRDRHMVFVMRESLPLLDSSKVYEVWQIKGANPPMPVGSFDPKSSQSVFAFNVPGEEADAFAISIEPDGNSTTPRGPVIMVGKVSKRL